ncbi:MAG: uroporphyrinogen decarboxylase family protein [Sedimentisphaerales bacterium]
MSNQVVDDIVKLLPCPDARNRRGLDARHDNVPTGRIAVAVKPGKERLAQVREIVNGVLCDDSCFRPSRWTPRWREALIDEISLAVAAMQLPGDFFPALEPPRRLHGQGQGLCEVFGCRVEPQKDEDELYFAYPLPAVPAEIDAIQPRPLETSIYYNAVEWIRYARQATGGHLPFRNAVMTSPFDMAMLLLGTTVLMEWVYTEHQTLHRLLHKITPVIIDTVRTLREAAGGILHGGIYYCIKNIFDLCSECRSLVSAEIFEEFEAPYLRMIGEQLGIYGIHSCGGWERTIPSALLDTNLRAMHGQIRENNLAKLCQLMNGRKILAIGESINLDERFTWPNRESWMGHVLETIPDNQPAEIAINEDEIDLWNTLFRQIKGKRSSLESDNY